MKNFFVILGLFLASAALGCSAANASVKLCNKSGDTLQIAIAHPVTLPYVTNEIRGWITLSNRECETFINGDFGASYTFYYFMVKADLTVYEPAGVKAEYPFCVTGDAFVRRGSWSKLQSSCPDGYVTREFYAHEVPPGDLTLTIYD